MMFKPLEYRIQVIKNLKEIAFDLNLNDRKDIKYIIEHELWILGEEYILSTTVESKERNFLKELWEKIVDKDNSKKMDIFILKKVLFNGRIRNIVVNIKDPFIKISSKEYRQIEDYKELVLQDHYLTLGNEEWIFILIGEEFSNNGFIERKYESAKSQGIPFLTEKGMNYQIFVKKWDDIFNELEIRHNFIAKKSYKKRG